MEICNRIFALRKEKGFSQEMMAEALDIDVSSYGRMEQGKVQIKIERLCQIAKILDVDITEFLGDYKTKELELLEKIEKQNHQILNILNFRTKEQ